MSTDISDKTMCVARIHGARDIRLAREAIPMPGAGEVLIRVGAVGLCGSDLHWYQDGKIGERIIHAPLVLGHEFAGTIVAHGPNTQAPEIGTDVAVEPGISCGVCEWCEEGNQNLCSAVRFCGSTPVDGALRDYLVMPAINCLPLPPQVSMAEGAVLETLGVGIHALDLGHVRLASSVAVIGGGSVGLLVAQLARLSGATEVYVSEPAPERRALANRFGCIAVDAANDPVRTIMDATHGRGVDVAIECAGAAETPQQACDVCERGGTVVIVGIPCDDHVPLTAGPIRGRGLTLRFAQRSRRAGHRALRLAASGRVQLAPLITHQYPLFNVVRAFSDVDRRHDGVIKAIIVPATYA